MIKGLAPFYDFKLMLGIAVAQGRRQGLGLLACHGIPKVERHMARLIPQSHALQRQPDDLIQMIPRDNQFVAAQPDKLAGADMEASR